MARVARDAQSINQHHQQRRIINGEYRTCPRISNFLRGDVSSMVSFWIDLTLRVVTAGAAFVALYVALINRRQWRTNQEKFRFNLYQRRFEIYLRVIEFHLAVLEWQDEPKLAVLQGLFLKAFCESKFLFPKESGIYDSLRDYNERVARVRCFKSRIEPRGDASQTVREQVIEDEIWIRGYVGILDEKLGPYLNFHSI